MSELTVMALLAAGPLLWMAGGRWWKGWRRYAWPLCACVAVSSLFPAWRVLGFGLGLGVACSLPYGEKTPIPARLAVFAALGLPPAFLAPVVGLVGAFLSAGVLSAVFWASRRYNRVTWKVWEGLAGFIQAALVVAAAMR